MEIRPSAEEMLYRQLREQREPEIQPQGEELNVEQEVQRAGPFPFEEMQDEPTFDEVEAILNAGLRNMEERVARVASRSVSDDVL